jgi:hypothetical protein
MTRAEIRAKVEAIMARAEAHMAKCRTANKCCENDCDEPLGGDAFVFGDTYCAKHAGELELDCLIDDQHDDAAGRPPPWS